MSQRIDRISAVLREGIQKVISKGFGDPRIRGLITVTKVVTADDLSLSTVYISILPEERAELTMHGLKAAAPHIRHQVGGLTALRKIPQINFKHDVANSRQASVLGAIARVTQEREDAEARQAELSSPEGCDAPPGTEEQSTDER